MFVLLNTNLTNLTNLFLHAAIGEISKIRVQNNLRHLWSFTYIRILYDIFCFLLTYSYFDLSVEGTSVRKSKIIFAFCSLIRTLTCQSKVLPFEKAK